MKTFLKFNPSVCSINIGDQIIVDSINKQMNFLFADNYCIDVSSHQPVSWIYANRVLKNKDLSFVMGSNLLRGTLNSIDRQWDINIFNAKQLGPAILIGVGWRAYNEKPNYYTKAVYDLILSHDFNHSVRDSYTEKMMRNMGFNNVINTSCATMWDFTSEFCSQIPKNKALNVVTTITDYNRDPKADQTMLGILSSCYKKVFVWIQGSRDYSYINELDLKGKNITFIGPSLEAYDKFLETTESVDYIGTRLHAGIRALQKKKRSLIIAIDNRANEKKLDFNLPVLERESIVELGEWIESEYNTDIHIPLVNIQRWKEQFVI